MRLQCVGLLVTEKCPEIVLKFSKYLVLKLYFVLLGPLQLQNKVGGVQGQSPGGRGSGGRCPPEAEAFAHLHIIF